MREAMRHFGTLCRLVPKDLAGNVAFRQHMLQVGGMSAAEAEALWIACKRDILFFINTFGFLFEPRSAEVRPFITWPFQDEALKELVSAIGDHDLVIEKSRDMGATWMMVYVFVWYFLFWGYSSFLLVSEKEELVDAPGDPKSMFWKLDFILRHLPGWLKPSTEFERTSMHIRNPDNESVIDGSSTTMTAGTGDRRLGVGFDEFSKVDRAAGRAHVGMEMVASSRDVSPCRIFNFTPWAPNNAAAKIANDQRFKKLTLHWKLHPEKCKGLYRSDNGRLVILDTDYPFPVDYQFILDGKLRSVAYDCEEARCLSKKEMAREWDIDYASTTTALMSGEEIAALEAEMVRPPYRVGELDYDLETLQPGQFAEVKNGHLLVWCYTDGRGKPPADRRYALGVDIATGTGASNSVISLVDCLTGEKVAEYCHPNIQPTRLARVAIGLARWFKGIDSEGAMMIWEATGPGRNFGASVIENGYRNIFYRSDERKVERKPTDIPGWWPTPDAKDILLREFREALLDRRHINRSRMTFEELKQYIYDDNGHIVFSGDTLADPSGAKQNHGDRVVADALACKAMGRNTMGTKEDAPPEIPEDSYMGRILAKREREAESAPAW